MMQFLDHYGSLRRREAANPSKWMVNWKHWRGKNAPNANLMNATLTFRITTPRPFLHLLVHSHLPCSHIPVSHCTPQESTRSDSKTFQTPSISEIRSGYYIFQIQFVHVLELQLFNNHWGNVSRKMIHIPNKSKRDDLHEINGRLISTN